ncbi:hypothetical protein CHU98_g4215 [Xylaria longipes]|nr:hypothetical protein CHU98_g4215 [Xylaria longipes]
MHSQESVVIVSDGHFKDAMNIVHKSHQYPHDIGWRSRASRLLRVSNDYGSYEDSSDDDVAYEPPPMPRRSGIEYYERSVEESPIRPSFEISQGPTNLNNDSDLYIPTLNRVEWDAFRPVGEKELFRKTKFHAIDVLEGAPLIKLHVKNRKRRKHQNFVQNKVSSGSTILNAASQGRHAPKAPESGRAVISKDHKQVYRVIKVSCTRHRVKSGKERTSLDFLKYESQAELDDDPVFVHCIYLDFDGKVMGPAPRLLIDQDDNKMLHNADVTKPGIKRAQLGAIMIRSRSDIHVLMRYAVALTRVDQLPSAQELLLCPAAAFDSTLRMAMAFVPHLKALGCRDVSIDATTTAMAVRLLSPPQQIQTTPRSRETLLKLAFCFANEGTSSPTDSLAANVGDQRWQATLWTLRTTIANEFQLDPRSALIDQHNVYFLLGLFMRALRDSRHQRPEISMLHERLLQDPAALPLPFDASSNSTVDEEWESWLRHTSLMAVREMRLKNTQWRGYRSNDPFLISFSGLMDYINLRVSGSDNTANDLKGTGYEYGRPLLLEGRLAPDTGDVLIDVILPGVERSIWHGSVTPFGILGYWTSEHGTELLGFFWIWRDDIHNEC